MKNFVEDFVMVVIGIALSIIAVCLAALLVRVVLLTYWN